MKTRYLRLIKKQRGFTLIELLAVILILGIIALIAIPTVNGVVKQVRKGSSQSSGNQIVTNTEQYYTMCELNNNLDKNGNPCVNDIKHSSYSSEEIVNILNIKGDFPEKEDIIVFSKNESNEIALSYKKDTFVCSNLVDNDGNVSYKNTGIINQDGVICTDAPSDIDDVIVSIENNGEDNPINSSNNGNGSNNKEKVYLKAYYIEETNEILFEDFHDSEYSDKILEINFVKHMNIPDNATIVWNLDSKDEGTIKGWLVPIEGTSYSTLYIGSNQTIYANPNSFFLLACLESLTNISFDNFDTSTAVNMGMLLCYDTSLVNLDLTSFDTSNVEDMYSMFAYDINLTSLNVSSFNTSKVKDMSRMFYALRSLLSLDVSNFDTSFVEDMRSMFTQDLLIETLDLSNFNTSRVSDMGEMFLYADNLANLDISSFDTTEVEYMDFMFGFMWSITSLDLRHFNTKKVKSMQGMFRACTSLETLDMTGWNTESVEDMSFMFAGGRRYGASSSTNTLDANYIGLENLNTSNVTNMSYMFFWSGKKTWSFKKWDTSKVTDMSSMFRSILASKFSIEGFDTSSVEHMDYMFAWLRRPVKFYVGSKWSTASVQTSESMFEGCTNLVGAVAYDSTKTDASMANWETGYLTLKS